LTSTFTQALLFSDGTNSFSLSNTQYNSPGIRSQQIGTITYRNMKSGFGIGYSNDGAPFNLFKGIGDLGDSYRSAAIHFSYKDVTLGFNIFTGERHYRNVNKSYKTDIYPNGVVGNSQAYEYMSSVMFIGYKGMRVGVDDKHVGQFLQNHVAHNWLKPQAYFNWREYGQTFNPFGGGFSSFTNPFILW